MTKLNCSFCFAQSSENSVDPTVKQLTRYFRQLVKSGRTFIQLSGGEPTMREDLSDIVAAAKAAGCENIQLNSNGIRLEEDRAYTYGNGFSGRIHSRCGTPATMQPPCLQGRQDNSFLCQLSDCRNRSFER